jgi:hypothetical protein
VKALGTAAIFASFAVLVALGSGGIASAHKAKPLKVSCEQLYAEIEKTGGQLERQYNAMGFTIGIPSPPVSDPADPDAPPSSGGNTEDGILHGGACQKHGKRVREGTGFMLDIHSEGEPPFPGEVNPDIREYDWYWDETVVRTKKGTLRDSISNFRCDKSTYDGSPSDPHNVQGFPC